VVVPQMAAALQRAEALAVPQMVAGLAAT